MEGYYDIHTHIVPGVDDGSKNIGESLEMIKQMREQGVMTIIATPHYPDSKSEKIKDSFNELKKNVNEKYPDMRIYLGNEILNGSGIIDDLKSGKVLTLAESRYVLVEFLPGDSQKKIYSSLRQYIMNGYIPVIAHIERYESAYKDFDFLDEVINMGAYIQMNTESLTGKIFDRRAAHCRKLLVNGYVHLLGSDCHGTKVRKPFMKSAFSKLSADFIESDRAKKILFENPEKILENKYI